MEEEQRREREREERERPYRVPGNERDGPTERRVMVHGKYVFLHLRQKRGLVTLQLSRLCSVFFLLKALFICRWHSRYNLLFAAQFNYFDTAYILIYFALPLLSIICCDVFRFGSVHPLLVRSCQLFCECKNCPEM